MHIYASKFDVMAAAEADVSVLNGDAPTGGDGHPVREKKSKSKTKLTEECAPICAFQPCPNILTTCCTKRMSYVRTAELGNASQVAKR